VIYEPAMFSGCIHYIGGLAKLTKQPQDPIYK
jgi:hypothetical protein